MPSLRCAERAVLPAALVVLFFVILSVARDLLVLPFLAESEEWTSRYARYRFSAPKHQTKQVLRYAQDDNVKINDSGST